MRGVDGLSVRASSDLDHGRGRFWLDRACRHIAEVASLLCVAWTSRARAHGALVVLRSVFKGEIGGGAKGLPLCLFLGPQLWVVVGLPSVAVDEC